MHEATFTALPVSSQESTLMSQELRDGAAFELLPHVEHKDRGELGDQDLLSGRLQRELSSTALKPLTLEPIPA